MESRAGWWRSANRTEVLFACPFAASCGGGNGTGGAACSAGYQGPVCAVCAPLYRRWGSACVPCSSTSTYALPLLVGRCTFTLL